MYINVPIIEYSVQLLCKIRKNCHIHELCDNKRN